MSSSDETTTLYYIRQLKKSMQRLEKRVKKQGISIIKLNRSMQRMRKLLKRKGTSLLKLKRKLKVRCGSDFDTSSSDGSEKSDSEEEFDIQNTNEGDVATSTAH
ncbi:unnamed protein product [Cuscuta epithymum]|nr:unnamed protein product [Cuscuta epithymum]CAH9133668.1 unnamed protein product [Cuscuta epithymum]